jgi:dienelactone hydrolase
MTNGLVEGQQVQLPAGAVFLDADLVVPPNAKGLVMFAHGSGSGRHSPRNRYVAHTLNVRGLGTVLLDLLTIEEEQIDEQTRHLRFDIPMLARRLVFAADWLAGHEPTQGLRLGLFGASTGAGAALIVAAERPEMIKAVVSRGGRPDLAGAALGQVRCPTLLIVGSEDSSVIKMNRDAMTHMRCTVNLEIVFGATHLFEEPGALERVAYLAGEWFEGSMG